MKSKRKKSYKRKNLKKKFKITRKRHLRKSIRTIRKKNMKGGNKRISARELGPLMGNPELFADDDVAKIKMIIDLEQVEEDIKTFGKDIMSDVIYESDCNVKDKIKLLRKLIEDNSLNQRQINTIGNDIKKLEKFQKKLLSNPKSSIGELSDLDPGVQQAVTRILSVEDDVDAYMKRPATDRKVMPGYSVAETNDILALASQDRLPGYNRETYRAR